MNRNKAILITGAASGIGLATAGLFAGANWFVGILDKNKESLKALEAEIGPEKCFSMVTDVTCPAGVREAIETFTRRTGGTLDVLFNNAGILKFGTFENVSLEDKLKIVDVNFKGVINCVHYALDSLKNTPGAHIIAMASASAVYGVPDLSVYSSTKSAICRLTEALDIELEPYGIVVSDILAPYVQTPMVTCAENVAFSVKKMGVKIQPVEVARLVWKAAHARKLHWKMGQSTRFLWGLFWLMPFVRRYVVKALAVNPNSK
ncbi:MAG: SDR family oxidoreductase [Syntrophaceae bacterium]|nr:SDR family oxidoreductase [Syntrophaceae bacterium]